MVTVCKERSSFELSGTKVVLISHSHLAFSRLRLLSAGNEKKANRGGPQSLSVHNLAIICLQPTSIYANVCATVNAKDRNENQISARKSFILMRTGLLR